MLITQIPTFRASADCLSEVLDSLCLAIRKRWPF